MRKLMVAVAIFTLIPGVAAAGGGGGDISACSAYASGTQVSMLDSCFQGIAHFAPAGETITISNDGELPHTFTAVDGSFNTGQLLPGETYELTVADPGIIKVFCSLHGTADGSGMAGVLLVGEPDVPAVSAGVDVTAIRRVIAEETQGILDELSRQTAVLTRQADVLGRQASVIVGFRDTQTSLIQAVSELSPEEGGPADSEPIVVTVPLESNSQTIWIPVLVGLAAGLGLSALIILRRTGRSTETRATPEASEPTMA